MVLAFCCKNKLQVCLHIGADTLLDAQQWASCLPWRTLLGEATHCILHMNEWEEQHYEADDPPWSTRRSRRRRCTCSFVYRAVWRNDGAACLANLDHSQWPWLESCIELHNQVRGLINPLEPGLDPQQSAWQCIPLIVTFWHQEYGG